MSFHILRRCMKMRRKTWKLFLIVTDLLDIY